MATDMPAKLQTYVENSAPQISALLVVRNGYIVFEQYAKEYSKDSYFNLYSITKSVLSALIGIALGQNLIRDIDQILLECFPELVDCDIDPRKRSITLRHVLSMTTGFDESASGIELLWKTDDVVTAALNRPLAHQPGEQFFYDDVSTHLLSVLLTRLTSTSAAAFAQAALFGPLGIWKDDAARFVWQRDPRGHSLDRSGRWPTDGLPWTVDRQGHNTGCFGLHLTARDMAKFGYLYMNRGRWDDTQIIPPDYVEQSTRRQSAGGPPVGRPYGYLWWVPEPHRAFFAAGLGGQTIHVIPGLDLVTVFTTVSADRAAVHRTRILEQLVLPAIRRT